MEEEIVEVVNNLSFSEILIEIPLFSLVKNNKLKILPAIFTTGRDSGGVFPNIYKIVFSSQHKGNSATFNMNAIIHDWYRYELIYFIFV